MGNRTDVDDPGSRSDELIKRKTIVAVVVLGVVLLVAAGCLLRAYYGYQAGQTQATSAADGVRSTGGCQVGAAE